MLCIRDSDIYMYMYSGVFGEERGEEKRREEKEKAEICNKVMLNETVECSKNT